MKEKIMNCDEIRELMPDLAFGDSKAAPEVEMHLQNCGACGEKLKEIGQTMALLDEWAAPEPSAYFDTRLQARLREEQARKPSGWLGWLRRPALAGALALLLVGGVSFWRLDQGGVRKNGVAPTAALAGPGTAVGDLQALEKNND